MKAGDIVIAPIGCGNHITPEKEYEVIDSPQSDYPNSEYGFWIRIEFLSMDIFCLVENCSHLNGGNWIIK
jgi:hypothetical protein